MLGGFLKLCNDICIFISPMLLRRVIRYLQDRNSAVETSVLPGMVLALALLITYFCQSMFFHQYFNLISTVQILVRGALTTAVFEKSCHLSPESRSIYTSGQIQNLMSTDSRTVSDVVLYIHMLWSSLEQIIVAMVLLVTLLGWTPTIAGILFIIATMPVQAYLVSTMKALRERASYRTDERVKAVSEAIKGIKLVKLYAWELSFVKRILEARARELAFLRKVAFLQAWNSILVSCLPTLLSVIAFTTYAVTGNVLNAANVFPSIALFNVIRPALLLFPHMLISSARAAASLSRLGKFLSAQELIPLDDGDHGVDQALLELNKIDLAAYNATFSWDPSNSVSSPTLGSVSFQIPEGSLVAVVGPTGGGKSSILSGLLGELPIISGSAGIRKNRSVSFCDQVPFIQNATVRDNILFGKPYDAKHYKDTIYACSLLSDFKILPAGDLTEIGGRGVNLSGGQRARVSLARAVYSRSDICLLDDPLCAVDAHVGRHLFNECIVSQLRGKTRILTTNQIHFAASHEVDIVIVVRNGTVVEAGNRSVLLSQPNSEFARLVEAAGEMGAGEIPDSDDEGKENYSKGSKDENMAGVILGDISSKPENQSPKKTDAGISSEHSPLSGDSDTTKYGTVASGKLIAKETKSKGHVMLKHYRTYFSAMGLYQWVLPIFFFAVASQVASVGVNIWLSIWSDQTDDTNMIFNLTIFFLLGMAAVIVSGGTNFSLAYGTIRASVLMHERLLLSVFGAPSSFFNSTPDGRLVNRFNSDLDKVDSTLGSTMQSLLRLTLSLMFTIGLILWSNPVFIIVVLPIGAVCLYLQEFYRKSSVDFRRLEAMARSPLYSHFSETLDGVVTIRAYGDVPRATDVNDMYTNTLNKTSFATSYSNRWVAVRLEALGTILIFATTVTVIFTPPGKISASMIGLVLSYTMQVLGNMTWTVRQFTESESQLSAVERIAEYSEPPFPQEEAGGLEGFLKERQKSSKTLIRKESMGLISAEKIQQLSQGVGHQRSRWPRKGRIDFQNVEMKYRADLSPALKGVSFSVFPGEHVGIVGRTGAGKSSAIQSLFRLYELNNGKICIDGVDISSIRLFDLRSALGIIPQEPVCFSGTIRSNLDMFGDHDDEAIRKALQACGLQDTLRQKVSLDSEVAENGANFSVGQRQLLCLGRALLKDSQVLILDEATSSVSNETDESFQHTLREEMQHCTILTVAHRLHTVMQNDRIIVMDGGKIAEIGKPSELLSRPSRLSDLVAETGPATAAHLRQLASTPRVGSRPRHVNENEIESNEIGVVEDGVISNLGADALYKTSLLDKTREAFNELHSALTDIESDTWRNELHAANVDELQWRHQLQKMILRLNVLSDDVCPGEANTLNGSMDSIAMDVSRQSADMLGDMIAEMSRTGMNGRTDRQFQVSGSRMNGQQSGDEIDHRKSY